MIPSVAEAFWDFTTPIQFQLLNTTIADYEVTETVANQVTFDAVIEPLNPRKLLVKPENQRRWKWWTAYSQFKLLPGQVVQDPSGSQFRVMSVSDWSQGGLGHYEYEWVQDPPVEAVGA